MRVILLVMMPVVSGSSRSSIGMVSGMELMKDAADTSGALGMTCGFIEGDDGWAT